MNIAFRADGSASMGLGHLMRCHAIAQAAHGLDDHTLLITLPGNPAVEKRFRKEGAAINLLTQEPGSIADARQTAMFATDFGADWIVLDGYHFTTEFRKHIGTHGFRLLSIDDLGDANGSHMVLNQNTYAEPSLYPTYPASRLLLGPQYALLRREFQSAAKERRAISPYAQRILISLGGSDPENVTTRIVRCLEPAAQTGSDIVVVLGASNVHRQAVEEAAAIGKGTVRIRTDVPDMAALMTWADLAVTAGGTTCYELLSTGLPAIAFITADNQERNVQALAQAGAIVNAGRPSAVSDTAVRSLLQRVRSDRPLRMSLREKGQGMVDGQGCSRVLLAMQHAAHESNE